MIQQERLVLAYVPAESSGCSFFGQDAGNIRLDAKGDDGFLMRFTTSVVLAAAVLGFAAAAHAGDISPQANREFIAAFAKKPGVVVLPSGLQYRVIKSGSGPTPAATDIITVSYKGAMIDGIVFDQTMPNETRQLPADGVIQGWKEALSLMKVGDEWELVVPSNLGYGETRAGNGRILPNQTLVFNLQLIAVRHPGP